LNMKNKRNMKLIINLTNKFYKKMKTNKIKPIFQEFHNLNNLNFKLKI
jgi:hypothetical protein